MFFFCGFLGMAIESRRVRRWLAAGTVAGQGVSSGAITEPASYRSSFNPFPSLVIGITGAAMSAHHQEYVFQVKVHELWGYLLLGFTALRFATYALLWLAPPNSVLPTRPPTEALAGFFLACGGLSFMFSSEELGFAAMRRGRDGTCCLSKGRTHGSFSLRRHDDVHANRCCAHLRLHVLDLLGCCI
jgi:hypothetical protein